MSQTDRIDLASPPEFAGPKVSPEEAAAGADAPQAPRPGPFRHGELTQREEAFSVRYIGPGGEQQAAEVISRIMDRDARDRWERVVAVAAGCSADHAPWRQRAMFAVAIQLVDPPKWLLDAMAEDDDLLSAVHGGCEAHRLRYFRGDDAEGGPAALATHVEVVPHSPYLRGH